MERYYLVSPVRYGGDGFSLTYGSDSDLATGDIVTVPLGPKPSLGIVISPAEKPSFATKPAKTTELPPLPPHLVILAQWLCSYYGASAANVWQTILPSGIQKKRRAPKQSERFSQPKTNHTLTAEQTAALEAITQGSAGSYLVHGITGSGKTELYLRLAAQSLAAGQSVIVLVPEIVLTPQVVAVFESAFGGAVITQHSGMSEADRHRAWLESITSKEPRIVIGPRSSLFAPLNNIGLIIVDESHESSYKQEQAPRYHAVPAAAELARICRAKLILGSATPGLGEYYWARQGRLTLVELTQRAGGQPLPQTEVVDLRDKRLLRRNRFFSDPLLAALDETLTSGRQALLFINRRGSASSQICADCGTVSLCPNCQLPLTFHADSLRLICHYCNYQTAPPAVCPNCGSANLRYLGGGTKRIEAEAAKLYPTARLARLDRDSMNPTYLQEVYQGLHNGTIDILIGTQMIAKGLDLPALDMVGVVSADTMLHIPDFSAAERTFDLITQVSGRAGRGDRPGRVIIQTYTPEHPAITAAARHDYTGFAARELEERRLIVYPPYVFLLKLTCRLKTAQIARNKATELASKLRQPGLAVLGPAPAFLERSGGYYSWHIIIKSKQRKQLVEIAANLPSGWTADLDPINLL